MFFDGNGFFHGFEESTPPPSLTTNFTGCSTFSTTIDGVLTALDNDTTWNGVTISDVAAAPGGFTLSESSIAAEITDGLSLLPSVGSPMLTYRGVADDQEGNSWTMSFSSNGGAVPQLVCVTEAGFSGYCDVRIGGLLCLSQVLCGLYSRYVWVIRLLRAPESAGTKMSTLYVL